MDDPKQKIHLTTDEEAYVASKVESGEFSSAHEVVSEGLRQLQTYDAAVEKWLRQEVVPVLKALKADPSLRIPAAEAKAILKARRLAREKAAR